MKSVPDESPPNSVKGFLRLARIIGPDGPIPVCRSTFLEKVRLGIYPRSYKLSARVLAWKTQDILDLIERIEKGEV